MKNLVNVKKYKNDTKFLMNTGMKQTTSPTHILEYKRQVQILQLQFKKILFIFAWKIWNSRQTCHKLFKQIIKSRVPLL